MAKVEHPVVAALYDPLMAVQDLLGFREQRRRAVGAAHGRVLEVGTGTGWNLPLYRDVDEVVALEPDPHMLERARRAAERARVPVTVLRGDGQDLPFEDASFDTAVFSLVLCTIPDPRAALREVRRVLRPDGEVVFLEHTRSPKPRAARFQDRITPLWRRVAGGCHPNRPTVETLVDEGFEVVSLWRSSGGRGVIVQGVARRAS